ncbi:RNA-binding domain-containing protein [Thozetella sp. PMI_491]|nr:RNA-binding domain-containing protein [Thozetella sp. PMI_491]
MDSTNWRQRLPAENAENSGGRGGPGPRDSSRRQPDQRYSERSRPQDLRVHRPTPQRDDGVAADAIKEGRRVYLGNLDYNAKPQDIEEFVAAHQVITPENIHISVDPVSGRNPGYCFLEFADRDTAEAAMSTLNGQDLFGREAKCRPCLPKGENSRAFGGQRESGTGFNRWGNWNDSRGGDRDSGPRGRSGPNAALQYFESSASEGKQLYVGGLPRMLDQAQNEEEMRDIFQDYEVMAVGKRISPKNSYEPGSERRNFCFVDFSSAEQAQAALEAVNGTMYREAPLKVSMAKGPKPSRS